MSKCNKTKTFILLEDLCVLCVFAKTNQPQSYKTMLVNKTSSWHTVILMTFMIGMPNIVFPEPPSLPSWLRPCITQSVKHNRKVW